MLAVSSHWVDGKIHVGFPPFSTSIIGFSGFSHQPFLGYQGYYDYLEIAGTRVSGTDVHLPKVIVVPAGEQTITWLSDHSQGEGSAGGDPKSQVAPDVAGL